MRCQALCQLLKNVKLDATFSIGEDFDNVVATDQIKVRITKDGGTYCILNNGRVVKKFFSYQTISRRVKAVVLQILQNKVVSI